MSAATSHAIFTRDSLPHLSFDHPAGTTAIKIGKDSSASPRSTPDNEHSPSYYHDPTFLLARSHHMHMSHPPLHTPPFAHAPFAYARKLRLKRFKPVDSIFGVNGSAHDAGE